MKSRPKGKKPRKRRKQTGPQQAVRESEQRIGDVFDAASTISFIETDLSGTEARILEFSPGAEHIFGYTRQEALGQPLAMLHVPEEVPVFPEVIEAMRRSRAPVSGEVTLVRKSGERFPALLTTYPIFDAKGEMVKVLGVSVDITERKLAEQAVRESEQRYRRIVETAREGIWIIDAESKTAFVNARMGEMLGCSVDEMLGKSLLTFMDDEWRAVAETHLKRRHEGVQEQHDFRFRRKDGTELWAIVSTNPLFDEEGRYAGALAMITDITGRKRAEEQLRLSEEKFAKVFRSSPDGISITRLADGRIVEANDSFLRVSGHGRDEIIGRTTVDLGLWRSRQQRAAFLRLHRRRGGVRHYEMQVSAKSGEVLTVEVSTETIDIGGEAHLLAIARDVTERKRAEQALREREEELRQAHKMEAVGRLAGGIAHDFNNLLTAITGYSEMLMNRLDADDPRRKDAEEINKAGHQGADLIRQLLAFSRKQILEPKVLDLNVIVADMERILHSIIGEDVQLVTALAAEPAYVKADPVQIEQVVMNLAANARDAMPQGGKLTIETTTVELDEDFVTGHPDVKPGSYVMLGVTDTGVGMDRETKSRLFEPFFTTKEVGEGTGLGLSTLYGIVRQSGGDIRVYSEPGKGTTFNIYLPCTGGRVPKAEVQRVPPVSLRGTETVLVVEDEDSVRRFVVRVLRQRGYTVLEAANSGEALPLGEDYERPIDLLLADVVMPELSGADLAGRLGPRRPGMRILYISGYSEPNRPSEEPKPIQDSVETGSWLNVKPKLQPDNQGTMRIGFDFEMSNITGFEKLMYKEKYPYEIPIIEKVAVSTHYTVAAGQTLLLCGCKMTDDQDGQAEQKDLFVLVKATKVEPKDAQIDSLPIIRD